MNFNYSQKFLVFTLSLVLVAGISPAFAGGPDNNPPPAPTLFSPDGTVFDRCNTDTILFSWSHAEDPSGIDFYTLEIRDGEAQVVFLGDIDTNDNDRIIADFPVDEYFWNVKATDVFGNESAFAATSFSFETVP